MYKKSSTEKFIFFYCAKGVVFFYFWREISAVSFTKTKTQQPNKNPTTSMYTHTHTQKSRKYRFCYASFTTPFTHLLKHYINTNIHT